jgi:predicted acyltransferase
MSAGGTQQRNNSLDALRGISILLMVLSGSIAFGGVLPAWMYHAQVPPPLHKFVPTVPGITWVDLVFPFFLFSMGAAIPLALGKWEGKENATAHVWWIAGRRFLLLTWFAIFTYHMRAWVISDASGTKEQLLSLVAFALLFLELYQPASNHQKLFLFLKIAAYIISVLLLFWLPFSAQEGFRLERSDIIIIVLGNMAFFGTIAWWHTRHHVWIRLGILPFIMAVFLGAKEAGSWNETLFNFSPLPWMYKFYYLKYLFIIIPGTLAGEWLKKSNDAELPESTLKLSGAILFLLITLNTALLFQRSIVLNLSITVAGIALVWWQLRKYPQSLSQQLFKVGSFLLLLGLFFEAYEGGIKKDSSTYSYYFVTSGLACFLIVTFNALSLTSWGKAINRMLATNGQNPMVAYVAGNLLVLPLLHLTGIYQYWQQMNSNAWMGFFKGLIFTAVVAIISAFFTKRKWFWKT